MGIFNGLRRIGEQGPHFLLGLTVVLAPFVAHPVLIRHLLAGLDAQKDIMGLLILGIGVMDIVGGHQLKARIPAHAHKALVYQPLVRQPVVLKLQEEVVLSEYVHIPFGCPDRLLIHSSGQAALHLPCQTGAEGNDSLMVGPQHLIVHPGFIVKSVHKPLGHNFHQVFITLVVLCQQHQVIIPVLAAYRFPVKAGARGHIDLASQDGLNAGLPGSFIKINDSIHHTMVRDSHAVHAKLLCPGCQLLDFTGTIQKAVFRMDVQMGKCHSLFSPYPCGIIRVTVYHKSG